MGLDPLANRLAKEAAAKVAAAAAAQLNPAFPYTVVAFQPAVFGLNVAPKLDTQTTATP